MEKLQFQKYFPILSDLIQDEHGALIGYSRSSVKVTGTAGQQLLIGDFLVMDSVSAETATIPADIEAIKAAKVLAVYIGNEAYQNMNTDKMSYNHNVTDFVPEHLTQEVVVINRGPIGLSWGGPKGTTKHFSGLKFPAGTSKADIKAVHNKLIDQGFKILRQVP